MSQNHIEREMSYLAHSIVEKFERDLKAELMAEAEKVVDRVVKQIAQVVELDAEAAIHMSGTNVPYAKVIVAVKDARNKREGV